MRAGCPAAAEMEYRAALLVQADHVGALNNLGNCLRALGRPHEALAQYHRVLVVRPAEWGTHNNIASVLLALQRPVEAEAWLRGVVDLLPDYAQAANNLGGALLAQNRLEEAVHWFERAARLDPELAQARFGVAMARLGMGAFVAGWAAYESRWDDPHFQDGEPPERLAPDLPRWRGEDIVGKRILLLAEQGLGDTIQFARFAPLVAARGAAVELMVDAKLVSLLGDMAPSVVPFGGAKAADVFCPLMSVPLALSTTLETIPPLRLHADPDLVARWRQVLGPARRRRVGLAISGSAEHSDDVQRSIPAKAIAELFASADTEFHLLQTEIREPDRAALGPVRIHAAALTDFSETAALMGLMDLVISVDTSVAHLAAALGVPTWILLPHAADWRWLLGRDDSPWYPAARLYRQSVPGDWPGVLAGVAAALAQSPSRAT